VFRGFLNDGKKSSIFAAEGFGFRYRYSEHRSRTAFMRNHGNPIALSEEAVINIYTDLEDKIVRLEYPNFIIFFYEWNENTHGDFPESAMQSILSKNGVEYLYGIKHGMTQDELGKIIDITQDNFGGPIWFVSDTGNFVHIYMEDNKIAYIKWDQTLE
jgi:hypothetical protein